MSSFFGIYCIDNILYSAVDCGNQHYLSMYLGPFPSVYVRTIFYRDYYSQLGLSSIIQI